MKEVTAFDLGQRKLCVLVNARSGSRKSADLPAILQDRLAGRVARLQIRMIGKGQDITDLAQRAIDDGFDLIAAVGGDGTQAAIAQALAGRDAVMAVLPGGTFNFFSRELGIGETVDQALDTLLGGAPGAVSIGEINGQVFLNNASFGAYPEILERRESFYRRWGRSRAGAYWTVLTGVFQLRRPLVLHARVDGQQRDFTTGLAFVARNALQLETLGLEGQDALRRDQFALFIARATGGWGLIRAAIRLAFGKSARETDFELICSERIEIETRPDRRLIARDGEKERMSGPFNLRMRHGALQVMLPAGRGEQ